jgi:hypothetical protein
MPDVETSPALKRFPAFAGRYLCDFLSQSTAINIDSSRISSAL